MWHASVSVWTAHRARIRRPDIAEREAVALIADVGGDVEWWFYNELARVGHLRVAITEAEYQSCPAGEAFNDAGESGPKRPRTYPKGKK